MAFTQKDRTQLANLRQTIAELEAKERDAIDDAAETCREAGLVPKPGASWHDVAKHAADICDALAPFDSGVRIGKDG